jgi:hypothetical protein
MRLWPDGKQFAFTVFDDTDQSTLDNAPAVYQFLRDLGFRTTKSVWPLKGPRRPKIGGDTCEDPNYLAWVRTLQQDGFEIGLHNVTFHTSDRAETSRGIDRFRELFGHDPRSHANHADCEESIYWGNYRLTGLNRLAYNVLIRFRHTDLFRGHIEGDPTFWGDLCRERITYVRNFVFPEINTLKACPMMPYHDADRDYVRYWFASAEGGDVRAFCRTLNAESVDRLAAEGGACIMYTHFGYGFFENGRLDPEFVDTMTRISRMNGWFVPVSELLDHLLSARGHHEITATERAGLERRWLRHKVLVGST